jgi:hypothetical protein
MSSAEENKEEGEHKSVAGDLDQVRGVRTVVEAFRTDTVVQRSVFLDDKVLGWAIKRWVLCCIEENFRCSVILAFGC